MAKPKTVDPETLVSMFGNNTLAAEALGVSKQAVGKWRRSGRPVPQRHYIRIANLFPKKYGHLLYG